MIKINEKVCWDNTPNAVQSEEAYEWIGKIYSRLGQNKNDEGIQPIYDKFGRPSMWTVEDNGVTIEIIREYINPDKPTWSKKRDHITVKGEDI